MGRSLSALYHFLSGMDVGGDTCPIEAAHGRSPPALDPVALARHRRGPPSGPVASGARSTRKHGGASAQTPLEAHKIERIEILALG